MLETTKYLRARAEAILGTVAVFMIGFTPPLFALLFGIAALVNEENASELPAWLCFSVCLATAALAVWLVRIVRSALFACHPELRKLDQTMSEAQTPLVSPFDSAAPIERLELPMAVVAGTRLPRLPILLRIPLALWWTAHFAAGAAIGLFGDYYARQAFAEAPGWVASAVPHVLSFGFSFAANIFLMLAIALFVHNTAMLLRIWKLRLLIDLLITVFTILANMLQVR